MMSCARLKKPTQNLRAIQQIITHKVLEVKLKLVAPYQALAGFALPANVAATGLPEDPRALGIVQAEAGMIAMPPEERKQYALEAGEDDGKD